MANIKNRKSSFKLNNSHMKLKAGIVGGFVFFLASVLSLGTGFLNLQKAGQVLGYSGAGTSGNPYVVTTAGDLENSIIVNALGTAGKYVELGANITTSKLVVADLKANFNGRNYTITSSAPFATNNLGTIKNANFAFSGLTYSHAAKVVSGTNSGTIENVKVLGTGTVSVNLSAFAAIANINTGSITKVINEQNINNKLNNSLGTAGIAVRNQGTISEAVNRGHITVSGTRSNNSNELAGVAAGVVAQFESGSILNVYNEGNIQAAHAANTSADAGFRGAHAGGIAGVTLVEAIREIKFAVNYGKVAAGDGGRGANGAGGNAGVSANASSSIIAATGGTGGFGGGAGGNAGAIIGYVANQTRLTVSNYYNFATLSSGNGGDGGMGAGGGGASMLMPNAGSGYVSVQTSATKGTSNGIGGTGAKIKTTLNNRWNSFYVYGGGAGGAGGGGAAAGSVNDKFNTGISNGGGTGATGGSGALNAGGAATNAGQHYGSQAPTRGVAGSAELTVTYNAKNSTEAVLITGNGGNGGLGGKGAFSKLIFAQKTSTTPSEYAGFDFSNSGKWIIGNGKAQLSFENADTFSDAKLRVIYNGINVTSTSSAYLNVSAHLGGATSNFVNGAWSGYTHPQLGGSAVAQVYADTTITVTSAANYMFEVRGYDSVVGLQLPITNGASVSKNFAIGDNVFETVDGALDIVIYVYDQLQGAGTVASPYKIKSFNDLLVANLYGDSNTHFVLENNITEHATVLPVASFNGVLNGNGKTITRNGAFKHSLIETNNGTIKNLKIVASGEFAFNDYNFGLLAGANNGTIDNVSITGAFAIFKPSAQFTSVGGVVGINLGTMTKITYAVQATTIDYVKSNLQNQLFVGAVAGISEQGANINIVKSSTAFENGIVLTNTTQSAIIGGVVGANFGAIENFISKITWSSKNTIKSLMLVNAVSGNYDNGTLVKGYFKDTLTTSATNYLTYSNSTTHSAMTSVYNSPTGTEGKSNFVGWDFAQVWLLNSYVEQGLPGFRIHTGEELTSSEVATLNVNSKEQLVAALNGQNALTSNNSVNVEINLRANINLMGYSLPMVDLLAKVTLNGNGFTISNATLMSAAMFNKVNGTIKNLVFEDIYLNVNKQNSTSVATLALENNGVINNVEVNSVVVADSGSGLQVSAFVLNNKGTIKNSTVSGQVIVSLASAQIGGLAVISSGTISRNTVKVAFTLNALTNSKVGALVTTISAGNVNENLVLATANNSSLVTGLYAEKTAGTVSDNFMLSGHSASASQPGITMATESALKLTVTYVNWNFKLNWYHVPNTFPVPYDNVPNTAVVNIQLNGNAHAWVLAYSSDGEAPIEISTSQSVRVFVGNYNLNGYLPHLSSVSGNIKFESTNNPVSPIQVSRLQGANTVVLTGAKDYVAADSINNGLVAGGEITYLVTTTDLNFSIKIMQPEIPGHSAKAGTITVSRKRAGATINYDVNYVSGAFNVVDLLQGDEITITYTDNAIYSTFKTINENFNFYLQGLKINGSALVATRTNNTLSYTFTVGQTTAVIEGGVANANYAFEFVQMKQVNLVANVENYEKANENLNNLEFTSSTTSGAFTTAYVVSGTTINLFAPTIIKFIGETKEFQFTSFTTSYGSVTNSGNANGATIVISNTTTITANYYIDVHKLTIELYEEGTTEGGALKYNAISINGNSPINNFSTQIEFPSEDQTTIMLLHGRSDGKLYNTSPVTYLLDASSSVLGGFSIIGQYFSNGFVSGGSYGQSFDGVSNYSQLYANANGSYTIKLYFKRATPKISEISAISGSGAKLAPYIIENAEQWEAVAKDFNNNANSKFRGGKYFELSGDIVHSTIQIFGETKLVALTQMGTENYHFDGYFNGKDFKVLDVIISGMGGAYTGLFGVVGAGATVSHVHVLGAQIINDSVGTSYVGAIAGINHGTISNVSAYAVPSYGSGTVVRTTTITSQVGTAYVGGLVGRNEGVVEKSYSSAIINTNYYAGGLIGLNHNGKLFGSYYSGQATALYVAGLIGKITGGNENLIAYSYSVATLTALAGGRSLGIAYNEATITTGVSVAFEQTYALNNVSLSFENGAGASLSGNTNYNLVSEEVLQGEDISIAFQTAPYESVDFVSTMNGTFNNSFVNTTGQIHSRYPLISNLLYGQNTLTINAMLNGNSVSLNDIDNDWVVSMRVGHAYGIPNEHMFNLYFTRLNAQTSYYIKSVTRYSTNRTTGAVSSTVLFGESRDTFGLYYGALELTGAKFDYEYLIEFGRVVLTVNYNYDNAFTNDSVRLVGISVTEKNTTKFEFTSKYKNVVITKVEIFDASGNLVTLLNGSTFYDCNGDNFTVYLDTENGYSTGYLSIFKISSMSYTVRVHASVNASITLTNASEGNNQVIISKQGAALATLATNGTHNVLLPIASFDSNAQENANVTIHDYAFRFTRTGAQSNVVETITMAGANLFTNAYGENGYDEAGKEFTFKLNGNVLGTNVAVLSEQNTFAVVATYTQLYKYLTINLNTTYTSQAGAQVEIAATNVKAGNTFATLTGGANAQFNILYGNATTISITNDKVSGENLFTSNEHKYRAIWVVGQNQLLTELAKPNPTYAFGTDLTYVYPHAIVDQTQLTLYLVEVFEVGADSALHETSLGTTLSTDIDHRPDARLSQLQAMTYGGKTLPGSRADINNPYHVDYGTMAKFTATKTNLSQDIDKNRYNFYNWDNKAASNVESTYTISEIKANTTAMAYYTIATSLVYTGHTVGYSWDVNPPLFTLGGQALVAGDFVTITPDPSFPNDYYYLYNYTNENGEVMMRAYSYSTYGMLQQLGRDEKMRIGKMPVFEIPYGELIDVSVSKSVDNPYEIGGIKLYTYENDLDYEFFELSDENVFKPHDSVLTTGGRVKDDSGYWQGIKGNVYGDFIMIFDYLSKINMTVTHKYDSETFPTAPLENQTERIGFTAVEPNGVVKSLYNTKVTVNDTAQITILYDINALNGVGFENFKFSHITVVKLFSGAGAFVSRNFYVGETTHVDDQITYYISLVTIDGKDYVKVDFQIIDILNNNQDASTWYKEVAFNLTLNFVEK